MIYIINMNNISLPSTETTRGHSLEQYLKQQIHLLNTTQNITKSGSFEWKIDESEIRCSDNFMSLIGIDNHSNDFITKDQLFSKVDHLKHNYLLEVIHDAVVNKATSFEVVFNLEEEPDVKIKLYGFVEGDSPDTQKLFGVIQDITYFESSRDALIRGQDEERKRVSLELHDSIGQKLIAIKYQLAYFKMSKNFDDFNEINQNIDKIINEVRTITHNLSNQIVTEVGFEKSLRQVFNEACNMLNASQAFTVSVENNSLDENQQKMIYRIVQEYLNNSVKYSEAKRLKLHIEEMNNQISILLADDGKGFDPETVIKGIGLNNIKQRVESLNGYLKIISEPNKGTQFIIRLPK